MNTGFSLLPEHFQDQVGSIYSTGLTSTPVVTSKMIHHIIFACWTTFYQSKWIWISGQSHLFHFVSVTNLTVTNLRWLLSGIQIHSNWFIIVQQAQMIWWFVFDVSRPYFCCFSFSGPKNLQFYDFTNWPESKSCGIGGRWTRPGLICSGIQKSLPIPQNGFSN